MCVVCCVFVCAKISGGVMCMQTNAFIINVAIVTMCPIRMTLIHYAHTTKRNQKHTTHTYTRLTFVHNRFISHNSNILFIDDYYANRWLSVTKTVAKEHEMANIVLFLLLFLLVSVLFMLNLFDLCQSIASIAILLTIYFVFVDVGIDCIKANKNGFSGSTEANYASGHHN